MSLYIIYYILVYSIRAMFIFQCIKFKYSMNFYFKEIFLPGRLYRSNQRFDSMDLSLIEGLKTTTTTTIHLFLFRLYYIMTVAI